MGKFSEDRKRTIRQITREGLKYSSIYSIKKSITNASRLYYD